MIWGFVDWPGIGKAGEGGCAEPEGNEFCGRASLVAGIALRHIPVFRDSSQYSSAHSVYANLGFLALSMLERRQIELSEWGVQPPTASLGNMLNGAEVAHGLTKQPGLLAADG